MNEETKISDQMKKLLKPLSNDIYNDIGRNKINEMYTRKILKSSLQLPFAGLSDRESIDGVLQGAGFGGGFGGPVQQTTYSHTQIVSNISTTFFGTDSWYCIELYLYIYIVLLA